MPMKRVSLIIRKNPIMQTTHRQVYTYIYLSQTGPGSLWSASYCKNWCLTGYMGKPGPGRSPAGQVFPGGQTRLGVQGFHEYAIGVIRVDDCVRGFVIEKASRGSNHHEPDEIISKQDLSHFKSPIQVN